MAYWKNKAYFDNSQKHRNFHCGEETGYFRDSETETEQKLFPKAMIMKLSVIQIITAYYRFGDLIFTGVIAI
jgi:hypothetical protein